MDQESVTDTAALTLALNHYYGDAYAPERVVLHATFRDFPCKFIAHRNYHQYATYLARHGSEAVVLWALQRWDLLHERIPAIAKGATVRGELELVKGLYAKYPRQTRLRQVAIAASKTGHEAILEWTLENGYRWERMLYRKMATAGQLELMVQCHSLGRSWAQHRDVSQYIFGCDDKINPKDSRWDCMLAACSNGDEAMLFWLMDTHAEMSAYDPSNAIYLLCVALRKGHIELAKKLVPSGGKSRVEMLSMCSEYLSIGRIFEAQSRGWIMPKIGGCVEFADTLSEHFLDLAYTEDLEEEGFLDVLEWLETAYPWVIPTRHQGKLSDTLNTACSDPLLVEKWIFQRMPPGKELKAFQQLWAAGARRSWDELLLYLAAKSDLWTWSNYVVLARHSRFDLVKQIYTVHGYTLTNGSSSASDFSLMEFAKDVETIKWLRARGCGWDPKAYYYKPVEVMEYLYSQGCPCNDIAATKAKANKLYAEYRWLMAHTVPVENTLPSSSK